jgi:D-lactate dehydrogenase
MIAIGFGMKIVACDAYPNEPFAQEMGFFYCSLPELLAESDVLTIHVPNLPETHHMIHSENIGLMKKGAYLINTARGAVVETGALIAALKSGHLGGAGLDVIEEEDAMKQGDMGPVAELLAMPNVILTPHTAFNTKEAYFRILDTALDDIAAFAAGSPINVVK